MKGFEPVATTTPSWAVMVWSSTVTVRGPLSRPQPRTNRPPRASNRDTAALSSQSPVASFRIRSLTIGEDVWEFDSFGCAFGHEATRSDVYAFSSNSFGEHGGTRIQMQANIRDPAGEGRFEGGEVVYELFVEDIDDFEDPAISWDLESVEGFVVEGENVAVEGTFNDGLTEGEESVAGTLEATCGAQSVR